MVAIELTLVKTPIIEIHDLHTAICSSSQEMLQSAIRIGELLTEERTKCKRGEWLPWLKANIKFSQPTAFRYMRIFKRRAELFSVNNLSNAYQISFPKKPKSKKVKSKLRKLDEVKAIEVFKGDFLNRFADADQYIILMGLCNWMFSAKEKRPSDAFRNLCADIQVRIGEVRYLPLKQEK